ncbi:Cysteinyl leukotriene receptor 1 [Dissostichus eleginoides]|uniref:Cysteinyl leukotriene receptor 1 n=1 Tax=Dissostichus eleginoides TaxID=100907 RepID=A0AAD9FJH0_DISEL|nr:Cysteinyl leukotriene receptor 1 [Dissostichus eleginoides]
MDHFTNKTKCFEPPKSGNVQKLVILNYLSLGVGFILPFLVILVCYAGIVRALLYRNHTARRQRVTDTKVIRMIVIVLLTFLISFMPYHVQRTIHLNSLSRGNAPCSEQIAMQKSVVVTLSLAAANSRLSSLKRSMKSNNQNRIARMKTTTNPEIVENHQLKAS